MILIPDFGYLQPYYTLEQAGQELNTILGKHAYSADKLLTLAMATDLSIYSLVNNVSIFANLDLQFKNKNFVPKSYSAHLNISTVEYQWINIYNVIYHILNHLVQHDFLLFELNKSLLSSFSRHETLYFSDKNQLIFTTAIKTLSECYHDNRSFKEGALYFFMQNELKKILNNVTEIYDVFSNLSSFEIINLHLRANLDSMNTFPPTQEILKDQFMVKELFLNKSYLYITAYDLNRILTGTLKPFFMDKSAQLLLDKTPQTQLHYLQQNQRRIANLKTDLLQNLAKEVAFNQWNLQQPVYFENMIEMVYSKLAEKGYKIEDIPQQELNVWVKQLTEQTKK